MVPAGCKGSRSCFVLWLSHAVDTQAVSYNGIIHLRSSSKRCCSPLGPRCHKQQIFCSLGFTHCSDRLLLSLIRTVPHAEPIKIWQNVCQLSSNTCKTDVVVRRCPLGQLVTCHFKSLLQSQRATVLSFHEDQPLQKAIKHSVSLSGV